MYSKAVVVCFSELDKWQSRACKTSEAYEVEKKKSKRKLNIAKKSKTQSKQEKRQIQGEGNGRASMNPQKRMQSERCMYRI